MLYVKRGIYWAKWKHRGETVRRTTGIKASEPDALRRAEEAQTLLKAERITSEGAGGKGFASQVTLAVLEGLDLQRARVTGMAPGRIKTLHYQWVHLMRHLGGEHRIVDTLSLADVRAHEVGRRSEGRPGQTIVRERQTLVRGLKLAIEEKLILDLPFEPAMLRPIVRSPKNQKRRGILHSRAFIELVLGRLSAKAVTAGHPQMCRFVMETGLRASELARAASFRVTETDWGGILHVRGSKETTERTEERDIPMSPDALRLFKAWKHRFASNDLDDSLKLASGKAGVERGVTLRDLRKFYGSHVAKKNLAAAQKLLGHASVATTALYVDSLQDDVLDAALPGRGAPKGAPKKKRKTKSSTIRRAMQESNLRPLAPEANRNRKIKDLRARPR